MKVTKIFTLIIAGLLTLLISFQPVFASSSGTYTSARIGEEAVSQFLTFKTIEQSTPDGTNITYSFAGSKDNYATWSAAQTTSDSIDLSMISNLVGSKYLKVKINMNSNSSNVPSVKGFEVTYETTSSSTSNGSSSSSSGTSSSSSGSNGSSSSSSNSSSANSSASTTSSSNPSTSSQSSSNNVKTQTVTLSQNQKKNQLVSTGSNLWVNLGIALLLTSLVSFLIFRKKYNVTADKI
ncbi:MAG: hypothetical protein ACD_58C00324G0002 [uncultured bacterium]|nr:MAG: hypothetical protein ACD_58C00324G0002 [uncultured bacterium]